MKSNTVSAEKLMEDQHDRGKREKQRDNGPQQHRGKPRDLFLNFGAEQFNARVRDGHESRQQLPQ